MMKTKTVKISDIKTNPNNPRLIKDDKFKKLVKSIQEFPQMLEIRPIVVNQDMIVLGGNMRLKACKEAGLKEIPIIYTDDLTEDQQRQFIIKDNVGFGEWDWEMIANEWDAEQLDEWGLDVPDFSPNEILEAEEDDYQIPDEIQTDIVLGDLFEIGEHRLLCGDSTDSDQVAKLMDGKKLIWFLLILLMG
jgi:ParB-like chromosome segregation protein Spo0J